MSDNKLQATIGNGEDLIVTDAMRQAVRREECTLAGHDFELVLRSSGDPHTVVCSRCGKSWHVEE